MDIFIIMMINGFCFLVIGFCLGEAKALREVFRRQGQTEEQIKQNIREHHEYSRKFRC